MEFPSVFSSFSRQSHLCERCKLANGKKIQLYQESEMATDKKIKEENDHTPYLPEELLINIFTRLPANLLHEYVRLVCKQWASVVRNRLFIEEHRQKSKSGLFIYDEECPVPAHFLEFDGENFNIVDVRRWFPGPIFASCDGIALFTDSSDPRAYWLTNPVTMQMMPLPRILKPMTWVHQNTQVSRIPSTGECKVVHSYENEDQTYHWLVLTVGVDETWRKVNHEHTFPDGNEEMDCAVISIKGVVYWPYYDFGLNGTKYFLAMDMAEESICNVALPSGCEKPCTYLRMGDYLSGFSANHMTLEVRVLKNWQSGEWCKMYDIDMGMRISEIVPEGAVLSPGVWLSEEVVIFEGLRSRIRSCLAYNVKKKEIEIVYLNGCGENFITVAHTNSLISW